MIGVSVNITGDAEAVAKLTRLGAALEDFREALDKIGEAMIQYYEGQVFASQGGVLGTPWAKLAPSTVVEKSKHYRAYSAVPLVASGAMQKSFTKTVSPKRLVIGNSAPYFVYHQSSAPRQKLPRRQMMGINSKIKEMIRLAVLADIEAKIAGL